MPVELIGLWIFLAFLSCAAVCAYGWQRRCDHTPRAQLAVDKSRGEVALFPLFWWETLIVTITPEVREGLLAAIQVFVPSQRGKPSATTTFKRIADDLHLARCGSLLAC
jgi:hypothetical protein